MTDSTGDWRWGMSLDDPGTVFNAERGGPWHRNPEQLPEFLVHSTLK